MDRGELSLSPHDKGPVGLGRSRGVVLKYLKIDILTVERERELETAVSTRVLAHVLKFLIIVRQQKIQRLNSQWEKTFAEKNFAIDVHWRNWQKFSLGEIFVVYCIFTTPPFLWQC